MKAIIKDTGEEIEVSKVVVSGVYITMTNVIMRTGTVGDTMNRICLYLPLLAGRGFV